MIEVAVNETRRAHQIALARAGVSRMGLVDPGSARLVAACGRSVATPAETHAILGLDTGGATTPA